MSTHVRPFMNIGHSFFRSIDSNSRENKLKYVGIRRKGDVVTFDSL